MYSYKMKSTVHITLSVFNNALLLVSCKLSVFNWKKMFSISVRGRVIPHITQIAAVEPLSKSRFNAFTFPKLPMAESAQEITGINVSSSGSFTVHGKPVAAFGINDALERFWSFLGQFSCVVLVAHNGRRFDFPVLVSAVTSVGAIDKMFSKVSGFVDSLPFFKKAFEHQECYKQEYLVRKLLGVSYSAHDANEDVETLGQLVFHAGAKGLLQHSFHPSAVHYSLLFSEEKYKNLESLSPLISRGIMKRCTAENVAGSGLSYKHLQKIFIRDGEDGLKNVFVSKNSEGQPRVTNNKRVLENVIPKLAEYFS